MKKRNPYEEMVRQEVWREVIFITLAFILGVTAAMTALNLWWLNG